MDKSTINRNLAKKIAVNENNTELERALAGKLVDIYKRLAERAEEAAKYRAILYSQFVKVNELFGFDFNEFRQNEIKMAKDQQIKELQKKLSRQNDEVARIQNLASKGILDPETVADLLRYESKPVIK